MDATMPDQSFFVHLQSLTDFANELQTQLEGLFRPEGQLSAIADDPLLLGEFGEASSLGESHRAAIEEMQGLLTQIKQAISFAEEVTNTVATGYRHADENIAAALHWSGGYEEGQGT
jgi:hypothetical protein